MADENLINMDKSSTRGISISIIFLFSIMIISVPSLVYGEEISVSSVAVEETSILELINNSKEEVNTLRVWVGSDFNFKSFKTEKGWLGEKTPQGVIIFTSTEPIKIGESVKFGLITDKLNQKINWKALDSDNNQIATGVSVAKDIPTVVKNPVLNKSSMTVGKSISTESVFRIIPEKPNVGSTIRVTGDNFGSSQEFDFYIDSKKLGSFVTDENGHFITTMKIPENQKADRVDFKIKDKENNEKKLSLRVEDVENRILSSNEIPLKIKGIPNVVYRGDYLEIFGTGDPNSAIVAQIHTPDGNLINSRTAEVNSKGNWEIEESVVVPLDAQFGKYSAMISDGRNTELIYWSVESDQVIHISPTKLMFEGGELITFNGTALPNIPLDLILKDSIGNEVASEFLEVDDSGIVKFQYQSKQNIDKVGTWTLFATQEQHKELIYVGYDDFPSVPVNIEFDKFNYNPSDTAHLSITGESLDKLSLLFVTLSGNIKNEAISIQLESNGKLEYDLKLSDFNTGIYNVVVKKGNIQSTEQFTIGMQTGSGEITVISTKSTYLPGESILLLGETQNTYSLLSATLFDPNGRQTKFLEFPSDDLGKFTESRLRIPSNGVAGIWMIKVASGPNFHDVDIDVSSVLESGMIANVEYDRVIPGFGTIIKIKIDGASANSHVSIVISDENGNIIDDSLRCSATTASSCNVPWTITNKLFPGIYSINVTDYVNSAQTTFVVE